MKKAIFHVMYEDSPGGKYYRKIEGRRYHVIEWIDMIEACGNDATEKYNVCLKEIDLDTLPEKEIVSALRSCGWVLKDGAVVNEHDGEALGHGSTDLIILEACQGYGHGAPLFDASGNNLKKLMTEARAESLACSEDNDHYAEKMDRPVNAIGSTAREYGHGDITSAIDRGCRVGAVDAQIMAKMYGVPQDQIDAVKGQLQTGKVSRVKLTKIPSDDPIAYFAGFQDGLSSRSKAAKTEDLAKAYLDGYRMGVSVKAGNEPKPEWLV